MSTLILLLSDLSYSLGLIGLSEMSERIDVANWLADGENILPDPRSVAEDQQVLSDTDDGIWEQSTKSGEEICNSTSGKNMRGDSELMRLVVLNKWHFTLGDADCVPSVPHGHENSKTKAWPKLNPYTGRVFTGVQNEDISKRLNRKNMQMLWRNETFVSHCRKQVIWYAGEYSSYHFSNARRGRLVFPRW